MIFETLSELSRIIREERKKQGLTQIEAAVLCRVGTRFLSDLENAKKTIHFGKVLQVLKGLGLQLSVEVKSKDETT
ncbi:MAG: helix-turn-helix transcriptional regulator [Deltaproteobacteria bacterium]|nr:MAG: helix-turn-helix transcriptional regulator [Deltaproteobacteria bacterium]